MDDLARWLGAQLDADEQAARAMNSDPVASMARKFEVDALRLREELKAGKSDRVAYDEGQADALHWAATVLPERMPALSPFGQARVLREIEAKREIIREHHRSGVNCPQCSLGTEDGEVVYQRDPCQTLRLLALPYSDRSGYDAERWAPWPIRPYPVPPWTLTDMLGIGQEPTEDDPES